MIVRYRFCNEWKDNRYWQEKNKRRCRRRVRNLGAYNKKVQGNKDRSGRGNFDVKKRRRNRMDDGDKKKKEKDRKRKRRRRKGKKERRRRKGKKEKRRRKG